MTMLRTGNILWVLVSLWILTLASLSASCSKQADETGEEDPVVKVQYPELYTALTALIAHINGIAPLEAEEIKLYKFTIELHYKKIGLDSTIIKACFDLVGSYDDKFGPLWIAKDQLDRRAFTNSID